MKTILAPLDGSEHSDQILALVPSLTMGAERHLHLLRVISPFSRRAGEREELRGGPGQTSMALRMEGARRHLRSLEERLRAVGLSVSSDVMMGDPAEGILATAERLGACMIAMTTHGRSGLSRWVKGSVAESVLRRGSTPVLLLNAREADLRPSGLPLFGRILVALDGSQRAAEVLPSVTQLALRLRSQVILMHCLGRLVLTVTPSIPPIPPAVVPVPRVAGESRSDAAQSLELHCVRLSRVGVPVRIVIERGKPADRILAVAESEDVDLVAMTTHGYSGVDRLLFGSVAESVLRACARPVLIVPTPVGDDPLSPSKDAARGASFAEVR